MGTNCKQEHFPEACCIFIRVLTVQAALMLSDFKLVEWTILAAALGVADFVRVIGCGFGHALLLYLS